VFSQILAAIDGSETGRRALLQAIEMKKLYNSQLTIMHVVETAIRRPTTTYVEKSVVSGELAQTLATLPDSTLKKTLLRATTVLEEARLTAEKEGVKPRLVLRDGEPAAEILREASKSFDLIILGFRGEHPSGIGLGSVVNRVVANAPCSVLVIRHSSID